jgi:hypothetical protein
MIKPQSISKEALTWDLKKKLGILTNSYAGFIGSIVDLNSEDWKVKVNGSDSTADFLISKISSSSILISVHDVAGYKTLNLEALGCSDHLVLASDTDNEADVLIEKVEAVSPITITEEYTAGKCKLLFGIDGAYITWIADHIDLTYLQFRNLNTAPITVITAPGANKMIDLCSAVLYMDYNSVACGTNANEWGLIFDGAAEKIMVLDELGNTFYNITTDVAYKFTQNYPDFSNGINKSVKLNASSFSSNTDSAFKLFLVYRIIDLSV